MNKKLFGNKYNSVNKYNNTTKNYFSNSLVPLYLKNNIINQM